MLATVVIIGTWFRHALLVAGAVIATGALLFTVDAVTVDDPCAGINDLALLPLGVTILLGASSCGATLLIAITESIRRRRQS